jgi:molybdate transport system substrate-binding protein
MRATALLLTLVALLASPVLARAEEILVFAAASLTDALKEIGHAYEAKSSDRVVFSFGASNDLARQIRTGAPADVFFSADTTQMGELEQAGLVAHDARRDVLSNTLAVVVPKAAETAPAKPADLTSVHRLALANPDSVPAGIYARTYLQANGLWDTLRDRVVPTLDVRAALAAVESENADAAIVYRTDAASSSKVRVAFVVPREQGPPIVYPLAPLVGSKKQGTAGLVRYLAGPEAARVYERLGFVVLSGK